MLCFFQCFLIIWIPVWKMFGSWGLVVYDIFRGLLGFLEIFSRMIFFLVDFVWYFSVCLSRWFLTWMKLDFCQVF